MVIARKYKNKKGVWGMITPTHLKLWKLVSDYAENARKAGYLSAYSDGADFLEQCDKADEAEHKVKMFIATLDI